MGVWRNGYTRQTQNLLSLNGSGGSNPLMPTSVYQVLPSLGEIDIKQSRFYSPCKSWYRELLGRLSESGLKKSFTKRSRNLKSFTGSNPVPSTISNGGVM
jgi:hypothetical protein